VPVSRLSGETGSLCCLGFCFLVVWRRYCRNGPASRTRADPGSAAYAVGETLALARGLWWSSGVPYHRRRPSS